MSISVPKARLVSLSHRYPTFTLSSSYHITIGSSPHSTIRVRDPRADPTICRVWWQESDDSFRVQNFATRGTLLNSYHMRRAEVCELLDHSVISPLRSGGIQPRDWVEFRFEALPPINSAAPRHVPKRSAAQAQLDTIRDSGANRRQEGSILLECPVCLEGLRHPVVLIPCAHSVCKTCCERLISRSDNVCPICRSRVETHQINFAARDILERIEADRTPRSSQAHSEPEPAPSSVPAGIPHWQQSRRQIAVPGFSTVLRIFRERFHALKSQLEPAVREKLQSWGNRTRYQDHDKLMGIPREWIAGNKEELVRLGICPNADQSAILQTRER